jgi:hypothetical protein
MLLSASTIVPSFDFDVQGHDRSVFPDLPSMPDAHVICYVYNMLQLKLEQRAHESGVRSAAFKVNLPFLPVGQCTAVHSLRSAHGVWASDRALP